MPQPPDARSAPSDRNGVKLGGLFFGTVLAYDPHVGLGIVELRWGDAAQPLQFQCMAIDDGSRDIQVGTSVRAKLGAGPLGALEAIGISKVLVGS